MSETLEDLATNIALFIGGAIDFCERYSNGKINKGMRLAFWEQILHHLGKAVLRSTEQLGDIETSMEWVERSVAPSLEKIRQAIGSEWYEKWLREQLEGVILREEAKSQIRYYHMTNGEPTPF